MPDPKVRRIAVEPKSFRESALESITFIGVRNLPKFDDFPRNLVKGFEKKRIDIVYAGGLVIADQLTNFLKKIP